MEFEKTGKCWCGCGADTDSYFHVGHDHKAEIALREIVYGRRRLFEILATLGYGPDNSVVKARDRLLGGNG